jgi:hypothetical protein
MCKFALYYFNRLKNYTYKVDNYTTDNIDYIFEH